MARDGLYPSAPIVSMIVSRVWFACDSDQCVSCRTRGAFVPISMLVVWGSRKVPYNVRSRSSLFRLQYYLSPKEGSDLSPFYFLPWTHLDLRKSRLGVGGVFALPLQEEPRSRRGPGGARANMFKCARRLPRCPRRDTSLSVRTREGGCRVDRACVMPLEFG